jgi:hypothetical protein
MAKCGSPTVSFFHHGFPGSARMKTDSLLTKGSAFCYDRLAQESTDLGCVHAARWATAVKSQELPAPLQDAIICWLTGHSQRQFEAQLKKQKDFEAFLREAPKMHPARKKITGVVCGVRVEEIAGPLMR